MKNILFVIGFIGAAASAYVTPEGFSGPALGGYSAPIVKGFKPKTIGGHLPIGAPVAPIVKPFQPKIIGGYQPHADVGYGGPFARGPIVKTFQPKLIGDYPSQAVPLSVKAPVVVAPFAKVVKVKKFPTKILSGYGGYEGPSVDKFQPKLVGGYQDPLSLGAPIDYSGKSFGGGAGFGYKELQGGFSGEGSGYDSWKKKKIFAY
ncbi:uncharacterized protein LOC119649417 isoform X2 [Hermetia illucens]|uniref:uncharacterized protein LOC119649417 isoform X1 n=1 Tax=Hermetia illucens TaxID=343691 RepID=UPI0018CC3AB1|nr:uncharacterized protein LOC119649417 isoform X1 [Hermetia illucens]XP_037907484.1 uncharacterized protein LOC119649417 isoform X2 [Hermetia illucens]